MTCFCVCQVGAQEVRALPGSAALRDWEGALQQQQLPVHPPLHPHQPVRLQEPRPDAQLLRLRERVGGSTCCSWPRLQPSDPPSGVLQARFSDMEDDGLPRTAAGHQLSSNGKQVRHSSQRSKVRGHGSGKFERTSSHKPTELLTTVSSELHGFDPVQVLNLLPRSPSVLCAGVSQFNAPITPQM